MSKVTRMKEKAFSSQGFQTLDCWCIFKVASLYSTVSIDVTAHHSAPLLHVLIAACRCSLFGPCEPARAEASRHRKGKLKKSLFRFDFFQ